MTVSKAALGRRLKGRGKKAGAMVKSPEKAPWKGLTRGNKGKGY